MRSPRSPRPRHELPPPVVMLLRPVLRFSVSRDAYVLKGIGNQHGPVLRRRSGDAHHHGHQPTA